MERGSLKLAVIGGGKMGGAVVAGVLAAGQAPATDFSAQSITVANPGAERREQLERAYGVGTVAGVADLGPADVVLLAVKPQVMESVMAEIADNPALACQSAGALYVSIAAGLPTAWFERRLPEGARVVRVMPNMPLVVAAGASGVCGGAHATSQDVEYVASLFSLMGDAVVVDETDMDAVCALSGSGPAYVAWMIEALRDAAAAQGLDLDLAERLALATVRGTAEYIARTDNTPEQARLSICSPGGTTLAALEAMDQAGFADVFHAGVDAAVRRSKELASC